MSIVWENIPLGQMSDGAIQRSLAAQGISVTRPTVTKARRKRGIPRFQETQEVLWEKQPLGQVPDTQLAESLGLDPRTIARQRHFRDIPAVSRRRSPMGVDWDKQPLGLVPDLYLARRLGVSHVAVLYQRKHRQLPRAPMNLPNELLGLVGKNPGHDLEWYASRMQGVPFQHVLDLMLRWRTEGFVAEADGLWSAVIAERIRRPGTSCSEKHTTFSEP